MGPICSGYIDCLPLFFIALLFQLIQYWYVVFSVAFIVWLLVFFKKGTYPRLFVVATVVVALSTYIAVLGLMQFYAKLQSEKLWVENRRHKIETLDFTVYQFDSLPTDVETEYLTLTDDMRANVIVVLFWKGDADRRRELPWLIALQKEIADFPKHCPFIFNSYENNNWHLCELFTTSSPVPVYKSVPSRTGDRESQAVLTFAQDETAISFVSSSMPESEHFTAEQIDFIQEATQRVRAISPDELPQFISAENWWEEKEAEILDS